VRPRKRAGALLLGAGVLFLIGTMVQAGWLFVIAALLIGAASTGFLLAAVSLRGLSVSLEAPDEAEQGIETIVELRLQNRARAARWNVVAIDQHLSGAEVAVPLIRPGERLELATLRSPARRGEIVTEAVELRSSAPFGVAERRVRVSADARTLVLPRMFPLVEVPFVRPVPTNEPAPRTAPRRGHGPDYLGIREYRAGDSMRHVHWGLTARHGQVMVREFEEERTRRLAIAIDTERDRGDAWTPLDRACAAAASLLDAAAAHGHGSRLVAATPGGEVDLLARVGLREQLRWLAKLTPTGISLAETIEGLGPDDLRGVETVVLVVPVWPDAPVTDLAAAAGGLADRIEYVACVAIVEGEDDPPAVGFIESLTDRGVDVRPWAPDGSLADALSARDRS
jgi:uncharacterized protein (DUF58 family)